MTATPEQLWRLAVTIATGAQPLANPALITTLDDAISDQQGTTGERGPAPKGTISDPTGNSATATHRDQASRDRDRLHRAVDAMASAMVTVLELNDQYQPSERDLARRKKAIGQVADENDPDACRAHRAAGKWAARGDRYKGLCDRCGKFNATFNVDPNPKVVEWCDSGRRVTEQVLARLQPGYSKRVSA